MDDLKQWKRCLFDRNLKGKIRIQLKKYGIDEDNIKLGRKLWRIADRSFNTQNTIVQKKDTIALAFKQLKQEVFEAYSLDRAKCKAKFLENTVVLDLLHLNEPIPNAYLPKFGYISNFYDQIKEKPSLHSMLSEIEITHIYIQEMNARLQQLKITREQFENVVKESQQATKKRNTAYFELQNWMKNFNTIAKVALINYPKLLQKWGITRSYTKSQNSKKTT